MAMLAGPGFAAAGRTGGAPSHGLRCTLATHNRSAPLGRFSVIDPQSTTPSSHSKVPGDEGLRSLAVEFPFEDLRRYAQLTSSGQTVEALVTVHKFVAEASTWDIRPRRQAAVRIAEAAWNSGSGPGSDTLPDPLWDELVEPTCSSGPQMTTWRYHTDSSP